MFESKPPDRGGMVHPHLRLLGIEADALCDYGFRMAGCAPDCEGEFEADCGGCLEVFGLGLASRRRCGGESGVEEVWRVVAAHVEALHRGWWAGARAMYNCMDVEVLGTWGWSWFDCLMSDLRGDWMSCEQCTFGAEVVRRTGLRSLTLSGQ